MPEQAAGETDYMHTYCDFWADLVETDGVLDLDKVARELHDYRGVMREVSSAYDQVTGGRFSKPNTAARYVADAVEERTQDAIADELRDVVEDLVTVREQCREDGEVLRAVGLGDAIDEIRNRLADRPADVPAPGQDGGS